MTDLVKRLRDARGWIGGQIPAEIVEAADRIEELESENAHLRAETEAYEEMAQEHAKAGGPNVMRRQMEMRRLKIRAEAAEAEVERLRDALLIQTEKVEALQSALDVSNGGCK